MVALAALSFGTVARQLREGSLGRLEHSSTALAAVIAERLHFLDGDMELVSQATPCPAAHDDRLGAGCDGSLNYALSALTFVPSGGRPVPLFGVASPAVVLDTNQQAMLDAGGGLVIASTGSEPAIYMVRRMNSPHGPPGLLIGTVLDDYLWGSREQNPLIPTMQLHIIDQQGHVLFRSMDGEVTLPPKITRSRSGTFEWTIGADAYLAAFAPVEAPEGMASPHWTLVLSEAREAAVAPMARFRQTFPWVALASLGTALILALGLLRRYLAPLHALQEGTRRLANHEFDEPVRVESRDEFAELADSFNAMAGKISRQFKALVKAAETDQAVLSSVDTPRIVATVLNRMRDVCPCDLVAITLIDTSSARQATTYLPDPDDPAAPRAYVAQFRREDAMRLQREPGGFTLGKDGFPAYLQALSTAGADALTILPLIYQGEAARRDRARRVPLGRPGR